MSSKRKNKKRKIMEQKRMGENMAENKNAIGQAPKPEQDTSTAMNKIVSTAPGKETEPVSVAEAAPVQSQPAKKEVERNLYLQYNNLEFSDKLMFEAAVNDYCKKAGVSLESIEAVNLYVKPEEGKAYYVIDHDGEKNGSIDL